MLEQWKRDRAAIDLEIAEVKRKIEELRGSRTHRSVRIELRIIRNRLAAHRHALHQRIIKAETHIELEKIFQNISGMRFTEQAFLKLNRDLEGNRAAPVSPLLF